MAEKKSRRYQIRWVGEQDLWSLFCKRWCLPDMVRMSVHFLDGVPPTAYVHHVFHDMHRRAFAFVLEDESFPEVAEGESPEWAGPLHCETVTLLIDKGDPTGHYTVPAYNTLARENDRLRSILSDYLQDDDRSRLLYEQARLDARREFLENPDE